MSNKHILACRLPGDSGSPRAFWDLISQGRSGKCDIPRSRFNVDSFYHPNGVERPGSVTTNGGYFLGDDIQAFENGFFGINNLEASYMDPQQRKLLEVVFECLENAGVSMDKASGSNTGCYVGNFTVDFQVMQMREPDYMNRYSATGLGTTILGNRVSHVFNLRGPSLVLDTACSSSLYCLHVACTALESYECDAAIVAGANLIQSVEQHIATMKAGVLSATSECHTFDISADGYGRADGIGALYVKRLRDAIRDGDPIRSIVRSSAVNANGKTAGLSLPSADGQELVIRKALKKGGLQPDDITYLECHGTGTKVGDAIEVDALSRVFKRTAKHPLYIGSVKTNVGHSEAASGISSVLKATLALEHRQIPPTYGLRNINPKLKLDESHISIPTTLMDWSNDLSNVRRIGINSFGYGGANAHVILEEAPATMTTTTRDAALKLVSQSSIVLPLSAATAASLEARIADFASFDFGETDLLDLSYTLGCRRTNLPVRGFLIALRSQDIAHSFRSETFVTNSSPLESPVNPLAFIFTGQGSQWAGMCRELFELSIFRNAINEMESALMAIPHPPKWSLTDAILDLADSDSIHLPQRSQTCCTAIQVAIVQVLAFWDILPSTVAGHSSGEIAAAFAAGYITSAEAIVIAYYRGYCVSKSAQPGAMIAVGLSELAAIKQISQSGLREGLRLACVNSPESVTISGKSGDVDRLFEILQKGEVFAKKLKTGGQAYHSHHMQSCTTEYESLLDAVLPTIGPSLKLAGGATFVSSVTGETKSADFAGHYWRSNLESQVRFSEAIKKMWNQSKHYFVEIGPHSSLELPIKQILASSENARESRVGYSSAIKRRANALSTMLGLAGVLWIHGYNIDWYNINGLHVGWKSESPLYRVVADLPPYRFTYGDTLWHESRASIEYRQRKYPRHELLGSLSPGGNGREFIYRNILRVDDVPWLKEHRLENTVVYPGAAYLAMAMEAVMQATDSDRTLQLSFCLLNVNITNALALSAQHMGQVEIFTSIQKSAISNTETSSIWWDFAISTYQQGSAVPHAKGSISISKNSVSIESRYKAPQGCFEPTAPRIWYENFTKQGLNYGSKFQSITEFQTPRMKSGFFSGAKAPLLRTSCDPLSVYPIHPITLDAMAQLAIVATTSGVPKDLRALVPTRFTLIVLNTPTPETDEPCQFNAMSQNTAVGSYESGAEIISAQGDTIARFDQLRLTSYEVGAQFDQEDRRHPILRVLWKPDVHGLGPITNEGMENYVLKFADEANSPVADDGLLKLGALVDLLAHKNPRLRILELDNNSHEFTLAVLDLFAYQKDYKRLASYSTAYLVDGNFIIGGAVNFDTGERCSSPSNLEREEYDLVIIPSMRSYGNSQIELIKTVLADMATIVGIGSETTVNAFASQKLSCLSCAVTDGTAKLVVARQPRISHKAALSKHNFLIIEHSRSRLGSALADSLRAIQGYWVQRIKLHELTPEHISNRTVVFNLYEIESSLLSTISNKDMQLVKIMTNRADSLVWVTNGNTLGGGLPEYSLVRGLSRALVLEQPALKFYTFDLDEPNMNVGTTASHLLSLLNQDSIVPDFEFAQHKGVIHVSRFTPDDGLNTAFRMKQGLEPTSLLLKSAGNVRLAMKSAGQLDTIFFKQQERPKSTPPGHVRIKVMSVGLNSKDFYVLAGKVDTTNATCQLECVGVIEQIGSGVIDFSRGDRVVAMAPTHFQTYQTLPQWACHKLQVGESSHICAALPLVYATALYSLHYRANIQAGETVLIHSGAGGVGIATIQLAKRAGAEIFTTVSTQEKKRYLIDAFGLKSSNIFNSRDTSFLDGVLKATSGRGVDVIINFLTGDQLHATWKCAAPFGRFVEIGKLDLSTAGRLEMGPFLQNTTFTAFDLSSLYYSDDESQHSLWNKLLCEVMRLYRAGEITGVEPLTIFDVSQTTQAFRSLSSRNRMGKIVINLENADSAIKVQPVKHTTHFDGEKNYILVGCLGGLGRTITRWMLQRGARRFTFLGRSGLDKSAACGLVNDLKASGAECVVIKGDVCDRKAVDTVVEAATGDIGGIVQAAMGLNESLFANMPNTYWHTGIDPKVQGSWHLYNSLRESGRDTKLDFFLLTSSVSGSVGTATEANYCAANHFLDHFARHLRSQYGVPAVAVGLGMISEVGYLHDNPDIEALLLRKGIQAIDADELLQIVDLALSSSASLGIHHAHDNLAAAHLLTGLEAFGLKELRRKGFTGTNTTWDDPRAALLANALDGPAGFQQKRAAQNGSLPPAIEDAVNAGETLSDVVLNHSRQRFADLVLMKYELVDVNKPLADYGMDSMLAAEFRTWFYHTMTVDMPILTLLNKTSTLAALANASTMQLEEKKT
ncbi:reducing type I polyketide synthase 10 [Xylaria acuta]|nr:reducing type I polyketide synthase 10 [Xylaria acuta]